MALGAFDVSYAAIAALSILAAVAVPLLVRACRAPRRAPELTKAYQPFSVIAREVVNHGERPVIFLTLHVSTASLPTGAHVKLRATLGGEVVHRSYTPTRFHKGECEIMFRVYAGGPMSSHLASLRVGDVVEMQGPTGLERYGSHGTGTFSRGAHVWRGVTHVAMVSGGTGITPMLQIANSVLQDPAGDPTRLSLVSFTSSVADIMLGDTLRALAAGSRGALRLTFAASAATDDELLQHTDVRRASMRALSGDALAKLLGVPRGAGTVVCVCGPSGFAAHAKEALEPLFPGNVIVW